MAIITLSTDLGQNSGGLAKMKGMILMDSPKSKLIDLSHNSIGFNVTRLAQKLKNIHEYYPPGTVHMIYAYVYYAPVCTYILAECENQFFIAPDNGILKLILQGRVKYFKLADTEILDAWPGELFARTAAKVAEGFKPREMGEEDFQAREMNAMSPVVNKSEIQATVIHIDQYGNAILNLDRETFMENYHSGSFAIYYKRHNPIKRIVKHYGNVEVGEPLVRFNRDNLMEVAINLGSAERDLELAIDDIIQIQFHGDH